MENKGLEKLKTIRHIHDMECGEDESINKDFDVIEKELKAFEIISKAYGDYANHKISEYELIMIVGENTTC